MQPTTPRIAGLPERFTAKKYLARTPYGEVVEAFNHERECSVALKLLRADGSHAEVARAMFRREVEALESFECEDNLLVIELELLPAGISLSKSIVEVRIGRQAWPSLEWRVRMAARPADAVSEAHRHHLIHRDIRPGITPRSFHARPFASPVRLLLEAPGFPSDGRRKPCVSF